MPGPYDPDLNAKRGGPSQAPVRGPIYPAGTTNPDEPYPPQSTGGNPTAEAHMTGEGWREMIVRYFGSRMKGH